jgi:hypothetical protein
MADKKELPPPTLGRTLLNLLPLIILTWYLCQNRPDKDPNYELDLCGQSLRTIGVALEKDRLMSETNVYTQEVASIFADGAMPACPVGGQESYTKGYQPNGDRSAYLLVCKGNHHSAAGVPSDYPRIAFGVKEASLDGTSDSQKENKAEPKESPSPGQVEQSPSPQESPQAQESPEPEASPIVEESPTPGATPNT